jgi:excisionase family DNA binding protein
MNERASEHNFDAKVSRVSSAQSQFELLTVAEASAVLRMSKSFLNKRRLDGTGPPFVKMGRTVRYPRGDLEAWAIANKRRHTSVLR